MAKPRKVIKTKVTPKKDSVRKVLNEAQKKKSGTSSTGLRMSDKTKSKK